MNIPAFIPNYRRPSHNGERHFGIQQFCELRKCNRGERPQDKQSDGNPSTAMHSWSFRHVIHKTPLRRFLFPAHDYRKPTVEVQLCPNCPSAQLLSNRNSLYDIRAFRKLASPVPTGASACGLNLFARSQSGWLMQFTELFRNRTAPQLSRPPMLRSNPPK